MAAPGDWEFCIKTEKMSYCVCDNFVKRDLNFGFVVGSIFTVPFKIRFREHLHDFKYKNGKSRFAENLIDNGHCIGRMEYIVQTLHITIKGKIMDTLEKYYIFRETKLNNQISDKLTIKPNSICDTIVRHDHHRGLLNA